MPVEPVAPVVEHFLPGDLGFGKPLQQGRHIIEVRWRLVSQDKVIGADAFVYLRISFHHQGENGSLTPI